MFPMPQKDGVVEAPSTHNRPVFSFSFGSRKNFPSKWDNAEKWLINGHDSPARGLIKSTDFAPKQQETHEKGAAFSGNNEKTVLTRSSCIFQGQKTVSLGHHHCSSDIAFNGVSALETSELLLKDKFTEEVETMDVLQSAKEKDTGTEMTPIGSATTSPFKSWSPPRHNTPATKLGLTNQGSSLDIGELQEWHFKKLQPRTTLFDVITSRWSSREEEEDDLSKSLGYCNMKDDDYQETIISGPRPSAWEEKEKSEYCLRYQMEEAKIQAWVNLQKAKAEAESRKLEVKIQKMRSKYEEKLMKKMIIVDRKAEELRTVAQLEHSEQVRKMSNGMNVDQSGHFSGHRGSCVCFVRNS
ncbi:hypothetical protein LXL04_002224 [Taraxacum kok-saghyz]